MRNGAEKSATSFALDASAVLAYLHREAGWAVVEKMLDRAALSSVNLAEVAARLAAGGAREILIREMMRALSLPILDFTQEAAYWAGVLRRYAHHIGLSLGDRACLATAHSLGARAVTADQSWSRLKLEGIDIQVIR